ncbi:MAG: TetR/AcrR family transcriptional regulator [Chitinophagaceae bacterium]|nr:MAG: TetR/AcrR family transcriptional regulator [Chitinophagaceae bacterium]
MSKGEETRLNILRNAFGLIYRNSYQATSIDDILATTKVTKGAFFHHFSNKEEMGIAMIKEVMMPGMSSSLMLPLSASKDAIDEIYHMMQIILNDTKHFDVRYGCPAMNLVEEMAPLNPVFRKELSRILNRFRDGLKVNISRAVASGRIRKEHNADDIAMFIVTGYSGIRNMGKIYGRNCYKSYLHSLKIYLDSL